MDVNGRPTGEVVACTAIHGKAFSGAYLATGCKEGILTVTAGDNGPVFKMLDYPSEFPAGQSIGTLLGSTAMQVFLGNYGAKGLVVVDPPMSRTCAMSNFRSAASTSRSIRPMPASPTC